VDPILEVDLPAFETGSREARRAVVDGVMRSLATGFVHVRHDLPAEVLDDAYAGLARFFALPAESKRGCVVPGSHGQSGYTGLFVETAAGSAVPDFKEMLNWGHELPEGHPLRRRYPHRYLPRALPDDEVPGIAAVLGRLHDALAGLQRRFLRVVAAGLGCAPGYFDSMLDDGPTLTRAIRYPPMDEAPAGAGHVWAAGHGDINLVTALPRATARGLQVRVDGAWVDAVAPEGYAILNTGMMLERLTNGVIPTGWHRVVAAPGQTGGRLSIVQFCHPTPWTVLAPIPTCVGPGRAPRHGAITAGDWLDGVLYDINLVEDAPRVPPAVE